MSPSQAAFGVSGSHGMPELQAPTTRKSSTRFPTEILAARSHWSRRLQCDSRLREIASTPHLKEAAATGHSPDSKQNAGPLRLRFHSHSST